MKIIHTGEETDKKKVVATIGFFDGVHKGHRHLIGELKQLAEAHQLPSAIITFSNHPRSVLDTGFMPYLLNTYTEKIALLEGTGIDYCFSLPFTKEISLLTAREFIQTVLADKFGVRYLLIGYDHRFGHNRTDDFQSYQIYGKEVDMDMVAATGYTDKGAKVSSSVIRHLLENGQVEKAAVFLTYPYQLQGIVTDGYRIGRTLGFPTANITVDPAKIIPGKGVYAVTVYTDGAEYTGMLHIGNRPTLSNGTHTSIEVHLLDFTGDLYGKEITLIFHHYIRGNIKFDSLEALQAQLIADKEQIRSLLK